METTEPNEPDSPISEEQLQFVEEVALGFERQGLFRMAGRVLGWLLICDPPEQSFKQLVDVLQASKGSISNAMHILVPGGLVEQVSRPRDRKTYYRTRPSAWFDLARYQAVQYTAMAMLTDKGLRLLEDTSPARRLRLQEMHDLYIWLAREMPLLWERWESERVGKIGVS